MDTPMQPPPPVPDLCPIARAQGRDHAWHGLPKPHCPGPYPTPQPGTG